MSALWSFVKKKQKQSTPKELEKGDCWTYPKHTLAKRLRHITYFFFHQSDERALLP